MLIIIQALGVKCESLTRCRPYVTNQLLDLRVWQVYFNTGLHTCFDMVRVFAAYLLVTYKFYCHVTWDIV